MNNPLTDTQSLPTPEEKDHLPAWRFWLAAFVPAVCIPIAYILFSLLGRRLIHESSLVVFSTRDTVLLFLLDTFIPGILVPILAAFGINLIIPAAVSINQSRLFAIPLSVAFIATFVAYPVSYLDIISGAAACVTGFPLALLTFFLAANSARAGIWVKQHRK